MQNQLNKKDDEILYVKNMLESAVNHTKTLEEVIKDNNIHINKFKAKENDIEKKLAD